MGWSTRNNAGPCIHSRSAPVRSGKGRQLSEPVQSTTRTFQYLPGRLNRRTEQPLFVALLSLLLVFVTTWPACAAAAGSSLASSKVVVVNDIAGHFEVLAGVLTNLYDMGVKPRVTFVGNPEGPTLIGLKDWVGPEVSKSASWHHIVVPSGAGASKDTTWKAPADVVVCVSAELAPKVCGHVVTAVSPKLLLVVVHRADTHTPRAKFLALHPNTKLMALAPHVANMSSHMLKRPGEVEWSMPVAPYAPPGAPCSRLDCLKGFALQGALRRFKSKWGDGFTRNYAALWARLLQLQGQGNPVPSVVVVGKGERRHLMLPAELESKVAFHPWLRYPDFWSQIYTSYALVPSFGMPVYYESRISSTILASLITCVPIIAEQKLMDTYTFLKEEHVFLRQPGEDEAAAMLRVLAMDEKQVFARRKALCKLRDDMNRRAQGLLEGYIRQALGT